MRIGSDGTVNVDAERIINRKNRIHGAHSIAVRQKRGRVVLEEIEVMLNQIDRINMLFWSSDIEAMAP